MSDKGQTSQGDKMLQTDEDRNDDQITQDTHAMATGGQMQDPSEMTDNPDLTYDWETSEMLQIVRDFPISDYGTNYDGKSLSGFSVPEPPSLSSIIDSTIYESSSETTIVMEKYVVDDMSSLSDITDIAVSNSPRKHEYLKERVKREGNIYDKLYNASLKGNLSIVKDILENHNTTLMSDKDGQTALYAACVGNHPEIINLLVNSGYDVNHRDNEGKTPLHIAFENHEPGIAEILMTQFNADTEIRDKHNWTPLHTAIDRGYFLYSQQLSQNLLQKDVGSEVSWIQLHAACFQENTQDVQTLLDAETNVSHASSAGHTPLHIAVAKSNINLVTLLLNHNADVNSLNSDQQTPLHVAVDKGEEAIIHNLLLKKADPSLKDLIGNTSLHLALHIKDTMSGFIKAGGSVIIDHWSSVPASYQPCNIETVQAIIEHGADVNAVNNRGQTALWFACCDGRMELVKVLLDKKADPNIADKNEESCLHAAIHGICSSETVQGLIDHGANVNAVNKDGASPLFLACSAAQTDSVKLLLKAKADPNIACADGDNSLHTAIAADCEKETLQELIKSGAKVDSLNGRGRTALLLGCLYRQTDSIMALLAAGADPAICDDEGLSCIHAAVDGTCSQKILSALIRHGAHIDAKRKDGTNALLSACTTGQSDSVNFLLGAGADVKIVKVNGNTCLQEAVRGECSNEVLHTIIAHGVDVNAMNNRAETALLLACESAQAESAKLLMDEGADPNICNAEGYTSLHAVIYYCWSHEILQEMMRHKPHLDAQNYHGQTALFVACFERQQTSIRILLEAASNPNIASINGNTSLHAAVLGHCDKKIIQLIIDHFADLNATNNRSQTALMLSCIQASEDSINVLLKAKADAKIADVDGNTCLHVAIANSLSKEVIQAIVTRGGDVHAVNNNCVSALGMACQKGQIDTIDVLIKLGADINMTDPDGNTYLLKAVRGDYSKEVVQAIINNGGNVNATNNNCVSALGMACKKGQIDTIDVLIKLGADINMTDPDGNTYLLKAVREDYSKEVVQAIINKGGDVNAVNNNYVSALGMACQKGQIDTIDVLIKLGADINKTDPDGNTYLLKAVREDYSKEVVQAIINNGGNVNATNNNCVSALGIACQKGQIDTIDVLITLGADINKTDPDGNTYLHKAVQEYYSHKVVQTIIDHGVNVNTRNKTNETALMISTRMRDRNNINMLLKARANLDIVNTDHDSHLYLVFTKGWRKEVLHAMVDQGIYLKATNNKHETALSVPCSSRIEEAICAILSTGADPNIVYADGDTYLHKAVYQDFSKEVLQALVDHGVNVNARNDCNKTALSAAFSLRNEDAVRVILTAGADPNIVDADGDTCLHKAVYHAFSKEVIQALIYYGVNVNGRNDYNQTALSLAASKRNEDAISILLTAGADPNIVDAFGDTCLHKAVFQDCSKEILRAMIDYGANVNGTNSELETALTVACSKGYEDGISTMLNAGADPNIVDADGDTCLYKAVFQECSKDVLQTMVDLGANVNAINGEHDTALSVACSKGHEDAISIMLNAGADPNIIDAGGDTCLHNAVFQDCSREVLQAMLEHGAKMNATNGYHETALSVACSQGNENAISVLLIAEADPNIVDADGDTCLHNAVLQGCSKDVLQAMVDHSANVNAKNRENQTALLLACKERKTDIINILLNAGADPNIADTDDNKCLYYVARNYFNKDLFGVNTAKQENQTGLLLADEKRNIDIIDTLLKEGADPNIPDTDGNTYFHYAVDKKCPKEFLQAITGHCTDINATNQENETALLLACVHGEYSKICVLLEAGADPNIANKNGNACIHYAAHDDFSKEVLQAILDQGADVNAENHQNQTALIWACERGDADIIHILLRAEADLTIADMDGNTCLHHAVNKYCTKDVLQAVINQGPDVNATNKKKQTPLLRACQNVLNVKIGILLDAGADPTIADEDGNTCLYFSVLSNCSEEVIKAIIHCGADVNAKSPEKQTALLLACQFAQHATICVLLDAGADPNIAGTNGNTCLHYAAHNDCPKKVLQALIHKGADVNATNQKNQTALLLACEQGNRDVMNTLLSAGADSSIADMDGNTCFQHIAFDDCPHEILQAIIDQGADVNATNQHNQTALLKACENGVNVKISILLGAGADPTIADEHDNTCLHFSVLGNCSKEVIHAIIDHGADVNATDNRGRTAFMLACKQNNVVALDLFLKTKKPRRWSRLVYPKKKKNFKANLNIMDTFGDTCLHSAVEGNCGKNVIQAIIDHNADVNATNVSNETALILACRLGNTHAMNILLNVRADPNMADIDGNTSLHNAILGNCSKEGIQTIVDHCTDVNATNNKNRTALMMACLKNNVAIDILLNARANPNIVATDGNTCLHDAVVGHCGQEVIQALIDHNADVNAITQKNQTALILACMIGNIHAIDILLNARANPNVSDVDGYTCLHYTILENCSKEVIQAIVDHGADVNATNNSNRTALMMACLKHNVTIDVLLNAGANPNIVDFDGNTCLHDAVVGNCGKDVLQAIMDHEADVNATNQKDQTALILAYAVGNISAMAVLLDAGTDFVLKAGNPNVSARNGSSWLHCAIYGKCRKTVLQAIIDQGADVNETNMDNVTPLMIACENNDIDAIHVLLNAGADLNIVDSMGDTCLHAAVHAGCGKEVFHAIINHGADLNITNRHKQTALAIACSLGNLDIMLAIFQYRPDLNIADIDGDTLLHNAVRKNINQRNTSIDC